MNKMTKILIISDNHNNLRKIKDIIINGDYDYVIHAGDFCCNINNLKCLHHKFYFTLGNNDDDHYVSYMPKDGYWDFKTRTYFIEINGLVFAINHSDHFFGFFENSRKQQMIKFAMQIKADFFIFGHTHIEEYFKYQISNDHIIHFLNPGSTDYPRNSSSKSSFAVIELEGSKVFKIQHYFFN